MEFYDQTQYVTARATYCAFVKTPETTMLNAQVIDLSPHIGAARRLLALRIHLGYDGTIGDGDDDQSFIINPRIMKMGHAPADISLRVAALKVALVGTPYENLPLAKLIEAGPEAIIKASPDLQRVEEFQFTLNALIQSGDDRFVDAWNGEEPADRRSDYVADDGDYLVLTEDEAFSMSLHDNERRATLAKFDGHEHVITVDERSYYIYRQH